MTVYTFKKDIEETVTEKELEEIEEEVKKRESIKALAQLLGFFIKPAVLMLLWNWLMPGIFGLATIGYLKAFGLYLISRILIGKND
ncbi:hypothetical protein RW03080701_221 [Synechococcus phage S-RIM8]|nr:hypothetical protein HOQ82_gp022 [Synechococcus phage S-RIM8]AOO10370.1 hypothetical protein RW01021201_224 [Synechococcus phage S-RIM8]AOO10588.1 hypothetical protein RW03080701_221 [Synechococcus phage S-RIM8]AOO10809.1 hypothetical protein RW060613_223 [Synechococcus phage S-RIM8]AOO11031.1 hypothetical protein RW080711_224 [Synechococcus phage S-RIM8]AOO11255.1 hypothetical protein RW220300_226 [Synechococcus phage S-RIM8]